MVAELAHPYSHLVTVSKRLIVNKQLKEYKLKKYKLKEYKLKKYKPKEYK